MCECRESRWGSGWDKPCAGSVRGAEWMGLRGLLRGGNNGSPGMGSSHESEYSDHTGRTEFATADFQGGKRMSRSSAFRAIDCEISAVFARRRRAEAD